MSSPSQSPFPPNPAYGHGATRRRIELEGEAGGVAGWLSDIFHEMRCWIGHDGERVTDIHAETIRIPNSLCPGATRVLRDLIGLPLDTPTAEFYSGGRARRHCTHLLDLAVLAVAHASRGPHPRTYDVVVPDQRNAAVTIEVLRNGARVHQWKARDGNLVEPETLAGRPLYAGFAAWAVHEFAGDDLEAAMVLARTYLIARGRSSLTEALAGQPIGRYAALAGACYAYAPERIASGVFVSGNVRDFSAGVVRDE